MPYDPFVPTDVMVIEQRDISSAQIRELHNTAVELVSAPGPNRVLIPHLAVFSYRHGTVAYPASAMRIKWGIAGTEWGDQLAGVFAAVDQISRFAPNISAGSSNDTANIVNQPLVLDNDGSLGGSGAIAGIEVSSALASAGTGYIPGDTSAPVGGNGFALVVVEAVDGLGAITALRVGASGAGYATGAGGLVTAGMGAVPITAVNQGLKKFTVTQLESGDFTGMFAGAPITTLAVAGSTGNDGTYTIVGAVYSGAGVVVVEVVEAIPSAVADGTIGVGTSTAGADAQVRIIAAAGAVTDVELLTRSGAGYAVNDTGGIGGDNGGIYEVDAVGDFGEVTAFTVTNPGSGYAVGAQSDNNPSGTGFGLEFNITSITAGDGTLAVKMHFTVLDLSE